MSLLAILETAVRLLATFVIMLAVISGCACSSRRRIGGWAGRMKQTVFSFCCLLCPPTPAHAVHMLRASGWIILYKVVLSQFPIFREVLWGEGADQHQQSDKDRPPSTPATPKRD
eukprot:m.140337 g.140337  ORF g.140337 m.140337 type:complete len:115 (+) comp10011_c1_seq2:103-447(+)